MGVPLMRSAAGSGNADQSRTPGSPAPANPRPRHIIMDDRTTRRAARLNLRLQQKKILALW
jgi:hypothetical protein